MQKLIRSDLYSLEAYSDIRPQFRREVLARKNRRRLHLGNAVCLLFENRQTMQYQIQEMLRIEKIFEAEGIEEELAAYNPLIPDGSNWKATMLITYTNPAERKVKLAQLRGIETSVWLQITGYKQVYAIADEDLPRSDADKTSAVHFLRFELSKEEVAAVKSGADILAGISHQHYQVENIQVGEHLRGELLGDLG